MTTLNYIQPVRRAPQPPHAPQYRTYPAQRHAQPSRERIRELRQQVAEEAWFIEETDLHAQDTLELDLLTHPAEEADHQASPEDESSDITPKDGTVLVVQTIFCLVFMLVAVLLS